MGGKAGKRGGDRDKGKGLEAHLRCMRENGNVFFSFSFVVFSWRLFPYQAPTALVCFYLNDQII